MDEAGGEAEGEDVAEDGAEDSDRALDVGDIKDMFRTRILVAIRTSKWLAYMAQFNPQRI